MVQKSHMRDLMTLLSALLLVCLFHQQLCALDLQDVVSALQDRKDSHPSGEIIFSQYDFVVQGADVFDLMPLLANAKSVDMVEQAMTGRQCYLVQHFSGRYLFGPNDSLGDRQFSLEDVHVFLPSVGAWVSLGDYQDEKSSLKSRTVLVQEDAVQELRITDGEGVLEIREAPPAGVHTTPFDLRMISPTHMDWEGMLTRARPDEVFTVQESDEGNVSITTKWQAEKEDTVAVTVLSPELDWSVVSLTLTLNGEIEQQILYSDFRRDHDGHFHPYTTIYLEKGTLGISGELMSALHCTFVQERSYRTVEDEEFVIDPDLYHLVRDHRTNMVINKREDSAIRNDIAQETDHVIAEESEGQGAPVAASTMVKPGNAHTKDKTPARNGSLPVSLSGNAKRLAVLVGLLSAGALLAGVTWRFARK